MSLVRRKYTSRTTIGPKQIYPNLHDARALALSSLSSALTPGADFRMGFLDPYRVSVSVSPISETIKRLNSRLTERFRANLRTKMAHFFRSKHQQLPNVAYQATLCSQRPTCCASQAHFGIPTDVCSAAVAQSCDLSSKVIKKVRKAARSTLSTIPQDLTRNESHPPRFASCVRPLPVQMLLSTPIESLESICNGAMAQRNFSRLQKNRCCRSLDPHELHSLRANSLACKF